MKALKAVLLSSLVLLLSLSISGCGSTNQEPKGKNTTFVTTKASANGKVYSVMVFKEITEITATYMRSNSQFQIPVEKCTYDKETTSIIINMPKEVPYGVKDLVFTVTGIPAFPAEFILCDGIYKRAKPGVFINGKKAVLDTDYTFDQKTNHLAFITPIDSDKDSYEIMWLTTSGTNAMSNNLGKYESQYRVLEREWYKSIK